ncbi:MAG: NAD-dependent epimerase/dehydratase family protein [Verrucomicrobia bacterium]|nr:NAD-dependent epimerase/dehydratase family protein [Verrucomicrobiota bacterium]
MSDLGNSEIQGKRILVAGAGGFLGQHLVERLLQAGAEVLAVSRRPQGESRARLQRIRADMVDRAAIRSIFNELSPDIVYQLCGRPDGGRDLSLVIPTLESDILTTVNLLLAAAEKPVRRFITTASLEESVGGEAPTSPYAAAKMSSVTYAKMFHRVYNVPVVVLRPFMTYGPKQPGTKIVSYLIRSLLSGEVPKLSSGTRMVDWVYIDDVMDGFLKAAVAAGVEGETFDLGSGEMVSIRDIANRVAVLTESDVQPAFGALPDRAFERERSADTDTTRLRLAWQPRVPLDNGLALTIDWWKKQLAAEGSMPDKVG